MSGVEEFGLIESLYYQQGHFPLLNYHLQRLERSCQYFKIPFPAKISSKLLEGVQFLTSTYPYKVRLLVSIDGEIKIESHSILCDKQPLFITVGKERVQSQDALLKHKNTQRDFFNQTYECYHKQGYHDVLYLNEKNQITQASQYNIFIEKHGQIITPPQSDGLLPGVMRQFLLTHIQPIQVESFSYQDLKEADKIYLTNAVRGIKQVFLN